MTRKFLISLCRPGKEKLSSHIKGIDWDSAFHMAEEEGLSGVVYNVLLREKEGPPPEILERFKKSYYTNVMTNLSMFNSLKPVLEYLKSKGITPIVFRGASLMSDIYPSFGMRSFQDIDLLVREVELFKTIDLLKKEGFYSSDPYISVLHTKNLSIDLHTDFMTYSRVKPVRLAINTDLDSIFERALEQDVQGVKFIVLHPEDGILALAVHLQMHSFDRLLGFLDIARLINHYSYSIDWSRLFNRAKAMSLDRTLYYSLVLMPEMWRTFDGSIIEKLKPKFFNYAEKPLLERLTNRQKVPYLGDVLFFLNTKGLCKKIRFLKGCLLPEEEVGLNTLLNPFLLVRFLMGRFIKISKFILCNFHCSPHFKMKYWREIFPG